MLQLEMAVATLELVLTTPDILGSSTASGAAVIGSQLHYVAEPAD